MKDNVKEKGPGIWFMTRKCLKYFLAFAWKERKSVYLLYLLVFIGTAISDLKYLLLPKLLVDEIVAVKAGAPVEEHLKTMIVYVVLTVLAEFLSRILRNIGDSSINYCNTFFERKLTEKLCEKSMTMDFQYTEDPDVLDKQQKSKE